MQVKVILLILSVCFIYSQNQLKYDAKEGTWISVDVSPDGKKIAFDLLGHIYEMPIAGGSANRLTDGTSWNMFPRYNNDGSKLLYTSDLEVSNDLWVMDLKSKAGQNISKQKRPVFQGTWSKDNRHVYGTSLNMKVRFPAYQFNFFGTKQEILPAGGRTPVNHFNEHPSNGLIYYIHHDGSLPRSGPRIKTYNMKTAEVTVYLDRPGGAGSLRLSPDGKQLAYVHRDDTKTTLVIHDLASRRETVLHEGLDYGRFESRGFYGVYPNISWMPNGSEVILSFGGKIHAINVKTKADRVIEFTAPVDRELKETIRFQVEIPADKTKTRSHRWGSKVGNSVLHEVMGDLYLKSGSKNENLTNSAAFETNPVYHAASKKIYYASWNDAERGSIYKMDADGDDKERLIASPTQYSSISVSPDGKTIAFVRGRGSMMEGTRLEQQRDFELVILGANKQAKVLAQIDWSGNRYAKRPPSTVFSQDGKYVYYADYEDDELVMNRINLNGLDKQKLITFSEATRFIISPDFKWIAFREFHRTFVTPWEYVGHHMTISAADRKGFTNRVDEKQDGDFTEWTADSKNLIWTRGNQFYEKSLADILAQSDQVKKTDLSIPYDIAIPSSAVALKNVRVITMNGNKDVLENATVLIEGNKITKIGTSVLIPDKAKVYDLGGRTLMPGIFDAHGHYGSEISALNVFEQNMFGLKANLAYGVTTMYDVYGTTQKDFWVSDMLQAGKLDGPRIYSVGDPMFVTKYRSKMYHQIDNLDDALEHVQFNKDHGATAMKDYSNHERSARQYLAEASRQLGVNLVTESFGNPQMNMTQIIDGYTGLEHSMGLEPFYEDVIKLFSASKVGMTPTLVVVYNGPSGQGYFDFTERYWEDKKLLNFFRKDYLLRFRRSTKLWEDDYYWARMASELRKLYEAGVSLTNGCPWSNDGIWRTLGNGIVYPRWLHSL